VLIIPSSWDSQLGSHLHAISGFFRPNRTSGLEMPKRLPDQSCMSFFGCCMEICSCNIYLGCYVLDNSDLYFRLPNDVNHAIMFVFPKILVLILLLMLDNYFNECTRARRICTMAKTKTMENRHWYLQVYSLIPMSCLCGCL
jgi:hypothetical protein